MLALTRPETLDACQPLPSIMNVMISGCDQTVSGITAADLAYLSGLYRMPADSGFVFQQASIADQMKEKLERWGTAAKP